MGRPPRYSREQLQQAALRLVDEEGIGGLSMRSLAAALGTGPLTLHHHVEDRAALDVLVVRGVMAEVHWLDDPRADWRDDVRRIAHGLWRAVRAHPNAIPLLLVRSSRSAETHDVMEALLAALARSGRSGDDLLVAFRAVTNLVMGAAQAELAGPMSTAAGESAAASDDRFLALPADTYPNLTAVAAAAATSDPDAEFRRSLDVVLAGLATGDRV